MSPAVGATLVVARFCAPPHLSPSSTFAGNRATTRVAPTSSLHAQEAAKCRWQGKLKGWAPPEVQ